MHSWVPESAVSKRNKRNWNHVTLNRKVQLEVLRLGLYKNKFASSVALWRNHYLPRVFFELVTTFSPTFIAEFGHWFWITWNELNFVGRSGDKQLFKVQLLHANYHVGDSDTSSKMHAASILSSASASLMRSSRWKQHLERVLVS